MFFRWWIIVFVLFLFTPASAEPPGLDQPGVPNAIWPEIYFESIDELTAGVGLQPLRSAESVEGRTEARIWIGFGTQPLRGVRLVRFEEQVIVERLGGMRRATDGDVVRPRVNFEQPERLWERLEALGMVDLPDGDQTYESRVLDGVGYVFEIRQPTGYRTILYSNPSFATTAEAIAVAKIMYLLSSIDDVQGSGWPIYSPPTSPGTFLKLDQTVLVRHGSAVGAFRLVEHSSPATATRPASGQARYEWIYRVDGAASFDPRDAGLHSGIGTMQKIDTFPGGGVKFGPFELGWSQASATKSYLYYPDPADELPHDERTLFVMTDVDDFNVDPRDAKWAWRASYTDFRSLRPLPRVREAAVE